MQLKREGFASTCLADRQGNGALFHSQRCRRQFEYLAVVGQLKEASKAMERELRFRAFKIWKF